MRKFCVVSILHSSFRAFFVVKSLSSFYRDKLWKDNNYISLNAAIDDEEEEDEEKDLFDEEHDSERKDIQYVRGDVTHPINTRGSDAIIVHCVGE